MMEEVKSTAHSMKRFQGHGKICARGPTANTDARLWDTGTADRCRLTIVMQRRLCCLCEHAELLLCSSGIINTEQEAVLWSAIRQRSSGFLWYHVFTVYLKTVCFSVVLWKHGFLFLLTVFKGWRVSCTSVCLHMLARRGIFQTIAVSKSWS